MTSPTAPKKIDWRGAVTCFRRHEATCFEMADWVKTPSLADLYLALAVRFATAADYAQVRVTRAIRQDQARA